MSLSPPVIPGGLGLPALLTDNTENINFVIRSAALDMPVTNDQPEATIEAIRKVMPAGPGTSDD